MTLAFVVDNRMERCCLLDRTSSGKCNFQMKVEQDFLLGLHVFEEPVLAMQD